MTMRGEKIFFLSIIIRKSCVVLLGVILSIILLYKCAEMYVANVLCSSEFYSGIIVDNVDAGGKTREEVFNLVSDRLKHEQENTIFTVICENESMILSGKDFDYSYNLEEVLSQAYYCARDGNILSRYVEFLISRNNTSKFVITANVSSESLERKISHIMDKFDDNTLEAHVEKFSPDSEVMFTYAPGKDGYKLDRDTVYSQIRSAAEGRKSTEIQLKKVAYKNTSTLADAYAKTQLIGEFKTISTNSSNSNHNMDLSMHAINGTVLRPGEVFSFNEIVGDSNDSTRGFLPGATIVNGNIVMAYGGGVCQAATTIYGAAIRADLTVLERKNHSHKSSYVPYGLDATIDYKNIDLKFRNDLPSPVYIRAVMKNKVLECQIFGPKSPRYDHVEVTSWVRAGAGTIVAEAEQMFYKGNELVQKKRLPGSVYKEK